MSPQEKLIRELVIREENERRRNPDAERPTIQPYAPGYLDYLEGNRPDIPEPADDGPQRGVVVIPLV